MPIRFVSGDLFDNEHAAQAFAHGCNCQGSMEAGVAKTFRSRYPEMYEEYRQRCKAKPRQFNLGDCWLWKASDLPWVFNLGTQEGYWRARASYEAIEAALLRMREQADSEGVTSIAIPRIGVGYGAKPDGDGIDAVYFVAQENYPVEFLELLYPVRLTAYGIHRDSGGAGRHRGGCGVVREFEILADEASLAVRIDGVTNPPWGFAGGLGGGPGRAVVNPGVPGERLLTPLSDGNMLRRGDILRVETGGGGGHGHPHDPRSFPFARAAGHA